MDSNFEDCLKEKLRKNKEITKKLNEIRSTMKTHHMVCNGFKTAGTGVSAAGTVLLTVSILAIPLTGGLSLLGGGWGLGLSLGGGATTILTNSIDSYKTKKLIQTIQSLLDSCENLNNNLQQHLEFINSLVSELGKHNIPQDEAILRVFHGIAKGTLNQLKNPKELIMKALVTLAIAKVTFKEITKVYVDGVLVSTSVRTWAQVTKFIGKATVVLSVLTTAADIGFLIRDWVSTHPSIKVIDDLKRQIDDESKSLEAMYYLIEQLKVSKEAAKKGVTAAVGGTVDALTLGSGGELAKAFTKLGIDTGEKIAVGIVAKEVANQALNNKGIGGKVLDVDEFKDARTASTSTGNSTSSISTVGVTATTSGNKSTSASGKGSEGTGSTGVNGGNGKDDERGSSWKNPAYDGDPPYENKISTSNARLIQVRRQRAEIEKMLSKNGVEDVRRLLREITEYARELNKIVHSSVHFPNLQNETQREREETNNQYVYNVKVAKTLSWRQPSMPGILRPSSRHDEYCRNNNVICVIQDTDGQNHRGHSLRLALALGETRRQGDRYELESQFPNIRPTRDRQYFRYFEGLRLNKDPPENELTRCAEHMAYESLHKRQRVPRYTFSIMYRDGRVIFREPCPNCQLYPEDQVFGRTVTKNMDGMEIPLDFDDEFDDQSQ